MSWIKLDIKIIFEVRLGRFLDFCFSEEICLNLNIIKAVSWTRISIRVKFVVSQKKGWKF